jgi:hypothetical protein
MKPLFLVLLAPFFLTEVFADNFRDIFALPVGGTAAIARGKLFRQDFLSDYYAKRLRVYAERKKISKVGIPYNSAGFPVFGSKATVILKPNDWKSPNYRRIANRLLLAQIEKNPNLAMHFSVADIDRLKVGKNPAGFDWHHGQQRGRIELVRSDIHGRTPHLGGDKVWGSKSPSSLQKLIKVSGRWGGIATIDGVVSGAFIVYEGNYNAISREVASIALSWGAAAVVEHWVLTSVSGTGVGLLPVMTYVAVRYGTSYVFNQIEQRHLYILEQQCTIAEADARWKNICSMGDLAKHLIVRP